MCIDMHTNAYSYKLKDNYLRAHLNFDITKDPVGVHALRLAARHAD